VGGANSTVTWTVEGEQTDLYFMPGDHPTALSSLWDLTGRPAIPPRSGALSRAHFPSKVGFAVVEQHGPIAFVVPRPLRHSYILSPDPFSSLFFGLCWSARPLVRHHKSPSPQKSVTTKIRHHKSP
jgi:hypothetical protein